MRDQQVLERGHALEKPDVLEGARDPRLAGDLVVGIRSSRKSSPFAVVACRPLERVTGGDVVGVATPSRARARRPSVGL